jgi:hypothetical protein
MQQKVLFDKERADYLRGRYGQSQYLEVEHNHDCRASVPVITDCGNIFINISDVVIDRLINTDNPALFQLLRHLRDSARQQEYNLLLAKEQEEKADRERARTHKERKYDWGVVYVLKAEGHPHYKIGKTRQFTQRMSAFGIQLPFKVSLVHTLETDDIGWLERFLHKRFESKRVNGEWFLLNQDDICWLRIFRGMHHHPSPKDDD